MPRKKTTLNRSLHIADDVTLTDVSKRDDIDEYDAVLGPVSMVCPVCGAVLPSSGKGLAAPIPFTIPQGGTLLP